MADLLLGRFDSHDQHSVAQYLCYLRNGNWSYDPGDRKHDHWFEKAGGLLGHLAQARSAKGADDA